jgi:tryptophan synthase beta chain
MKMHTLGSGFLPEAIHAGGLRYHGDAPILCSLVNDGVAEAKAYYQTECFDAARLFLKTEGFLPAPETSHAIKGAIDAAREAEPGQVIVFLYSGHGLLDLGSYEAYLKGNLQDFAYPEEKIAEALRDCPDICL